MCQVPDDNTLCAGPCQDDELASNWKYQGMGQGEYQIVEELVWVGEGRGSFGAPPPDEDLNWLQRQRQMCTRELVCMAFYGSIVVMTLVCLFLGVVMLIPPVASKIDTIWSLPMSHHSTLHRQEPEGARAMQQVSSATTLAPLVELPSRGMALAPIVAVPNQHQLGTTPPPVVDVPTLSPVVEVPSTTKQYDCSAGYFSWRAAWSAEKKDWCCFHQQRGCELSAALSPGSARASGLQGCNRMCWLRDQNVPCGKRIQYAASHAYFGKPHSCSLAVVQVHSECSTCQVCSLAQSGCTESMLVSMTTGAPSMASFDCNSGLQRCGQSWSPQKKAWCSVHGGNTCVDNAVMGG